MQLGKTDAFEGPRVMCTKDSAIYQGDGSAQLVRDITTSTFRHYPASKAALPEALCDRKRPGLHTLTLLNHVVNERRARRGGMYQDKV